MSFLVTEKSIGNSDIQTSLITKRQFLEYLNGISSKNVILKSYKIISNVFI